MQLISKQHAHTQSLYFHILRNPLLKGKKLPVMEHFPPDNILFSRPTFSPLSGFASAGKAEPPAIALETGESKYKWDWVGALLRVFTVASSHSLCTLGLSLFPRGVMLASVPGSPDSGIHCYSRCVCKKKKSVRTCMFICVYMPNILWEFITD